MNVISTNNSPCKVVSKYFSSIPVMDESLSEFKEKKGSCKGPKNSQKPVTKVKVKKLPKRVKGQKDIRAALKSKTSDQLIYSKEFDEVCRQAGVDVDSEQLQLAIALSKSLHPPEENDSSTSQKALSSQERSKKIRTTLQEYGFAVPEIKKPNKRLKNGRDKYKLLLSRDDEKQQIISDRYAQVLFTNAINTNVRDDQDVDYSIMKCYYVATGITYMSLQNNSILYVEDLVERSTSKGSLLRDWASIPGRPESPVKKGVFNMNISEIECSQEELDIVLSGTLKSSKAVVKNMIDSVSRSTPAIVIDGDNAITELHKTKVDKRNDTLVNDDSVNTETDVSKNKTLLISDRVRSCSPDIFDDEVSLIFDNDNDARSYASKIKVLAVMDLTEDDKCSVHASQNFGQSVKDKKTNIMDLTQTENDGRNDNSQKTNVATKSLKQTPHCSQDDNFTKRNSNDFMEITECIGISPFKINSKTDVQDILKLSQGSNKSRRCSDELMEVIQCVAMCLESSPDKSNVPATNLQIANTTKRKSNDPMEMTECVSKEFCIPVNVEANIDLTQNSDEDNTTVVGGVVNNTLNKEYLSQSSNSDDELPLVQITKTNKSLDETILISNDEIISNQPKSLSKTGESEPSLITEQILDLTDTPPSPVKLYYNDRSSNNSFFDEFVHNHSDDTTKETLEKSAQSENDVFLSKNPNDNVKIDLTQSSDSSVTNLEENSGNCSSHTFKTDSGRKNSQLSLDYDEMYNAIAKNFSNTSKNQCSIIYDITDGNEANTESENVSQNSQEFDVSDKELEYSLNQSRCEVALGADFNGISVINNDLADSGTNYEKEKYVPDQSLHQSMSDSFLPIVKVKGSVDKDTSLDRFKTPATLLSKDIVTPSKAISSNAVAINTPDNEYIVKTDQVTPILDYASMTTPERNRELDKYGLKPFKRKRAIQLLTHLYNQTHPIVETCPEDLPSPSKRRKHSQPSPKKHQLPVKSPNKWKTTKKSLSPIKKYQPIDSMDDRENNVYEVTNELPEIRAIECSEEDLVFQKREKGKIQSCRVPLHIALHNYVSCRRRLREAILRYEPVNIDVIHKELAASGYRYDPKDLLKYLDKKCITVKTADNNARNNKT